MLRTICAAALVSALLLSGCSGKRLSDDQLRSAATQIVSISAEGELLATAAAGDHVGANYSKGHPEYLRKQAEDVAKDLSQGEAGAADVQRRLERLRLAATRLKETLDALPSTPEDTRWSQSRSQLENIRREADEIRRTF